MLTHERPLVGMGVHLLLVVPHVHLTEESLPTKLALVVVRVGNLKKIVHL